MTVWPPGESEMARRIRERDWASTPLGPIGSWPASLKVVADLLLASGFPMVALWGPDLVQIYNDGYRAIMGERHPAGLGQRTRECWPEVWSINAPIYERVRAGETLSFEDALYPIVRHGAIEDAWFTLSYSPLRDEGVVVGVLVTVVETTARLRAEAALRENEERLRRSEDDLRLLTDAVPVQIGYMDRDQRYRFVNAEFGRFFGVPKDALLGRTLRECVGERTHERLRPFVERVLSGETMRFEDREPDKHGPGRDSWTEENYIPRFAPDGTVAGFFSLNIDITERKRTEAVLRESEERYRLIVEGARDYAIFTTDSDGIIETWPPGAEAVFGWSAQEAIGQPVAMTYVPEDRASDAPGRERAEARATGSAPNVRWHQRNDGSRVFIEGAMMALRDGGGSLRRYLKIGQNVTARHRAEAALAESEERFRSFAENSADTLWILDAKTGRLEYLSPAFEAMWGESRERVMGDLGRWADLVHPDDRARAMGGMPRLLSGETYTQEYRVVRPSDGAVRWIEDTGFPIRDGEGRLRRVAGIAQDATARKEAAAAIRTSRRRLCSLIEGIPQLVWRAGEAGRWTWASPQWSAHTGLAEAASLGLGWLDAVHPEDREAALAAWARAEAEGRFEADYRLRPAGEGPYRWFQARAVPVRDEAGEAVEWLGTSTDVDDLRGLQERQGLLLAELQHRVRNTLGVVRSIARRTARSSDTVEDYAAHLDGRLNAFGRVQAAVTRDPAAGVDLGQLVGDTLLAHGAHEGKRVRRITGPAVRLQPKAAETIALAIHELTTNAVKYGALSVERGRIQVEWNLEADDGREHVVLRWTETGVKLTGERPSRRGFGSDLIERTIAYDLKGEVSLAFTASGLHCTISLPAGETLVTTKIRSA